MITWHHRIIRGWGTDSMRVRKIKEVTQLDAIAQDDRIAERMEGGRKYAMHIPYCIAVTVYTVPAVLQFQFTLYISV